MPSLNIEAAIIYNAQASNAGFDLGHEVSEHHRIIRRDVERLACYAYAGQGCDDVSGWLFTHERIMHLKFVVRQRVNYLDTREAIAMRGTVDELNAFLWEAGHIV